MEYGIAIAILVLAIGGTAWLTHNKTKRVRWIAWGIVGMLILTPIASWLISISYAIYEGDGFAGVALMMILLPLFFISGSIILIRGLFLKK